MKFNVSNTCQFFSYFLLWPFLESQRYFSPMLIYFKHDFLLFQAFHIVGAHFFEFLTITIFPSLIGIYNSNYYSKFREFETVRTIKIHKKRPNTDQNNFLGSTIMKNQQKRRKEKKGIFQNLFAFFFLSSFFVGFS